MTNTMTKKGNRVGRRLYSKRNIALYIMLIFPLIQVIVFKYLPMLGATVAFKDFNKFKGIWDSPWIGLEHFKEAFRSNHFWLSLKNTLVLNLGDLVLAFPIAIIFAVLLFEVKNKHLRNTTQVITYLPHFLSWVIISGIVVQVFSAQGLMNTVLVSLGFNKVNFLTDSGNWRLIYWMSGIWQGTGYNLIIYMAALSGADTSLYEAAYLDGAGRWKRIWYVTIPQIKSTITTLLIMSLGRMVSISFDRPYMLKNSLVSDTAEVISTYVYSVGLNSGRFDFAAAIGLFQSVVGVILLFMVNSIIRRMGEEGIL